MKDLARELAELWPERFEFTAAEGSVLWTCWDRVRHARLHDANDFIFWAFWGPLATEMGVMCDDLGYDAGEAGIVAHVPILEALASAVVAKVREVRR